MTFVLYILERLWIHQCLKLHFLGQNIVKTEAEQPTNPIGWNLNELHRNCYLKSQVHSLTFKKWLLRPVWQCRATDTSVAHTAQHLAGRRALGLKYDGLCSRYWQGGQLPGVYAHPTPSCSTTGSPWLWTAASYLRWKMVQFFGLTPLKSLRESWGH